MTVSEALRNLFDALPSQAQGVEVCGLVDAAQRVLAEDVVCPFDLPSFDRSAVDGYAIRAVDSIGASPTNPLELRVTTTVAAGARPEEVAEVRNGCAAMIFTGAPLPSGTDAVVMAEYCSHIENVVQIHRQVHSLQNVSRRGEDYAKSDVMVNAGTVLKPWHIAAIASIGSGTVRVRRKLRLGVLSTGSEVVDAGKPLKPGQIANSTKPMLLALAKQEGCEPVDLGTVPDELVTIRESLVKGLRVCDVLLTTGGSSVGAKDLVPEALLSLHDQRFVAHGIRLRPGRPTGVAVVGGKPVFLLSGFPVAALTGFQALVKATLQKLVGSTEEPAPVANGTLTRRVSNESGTKSYVRTRVSQVNGGLQIEPLMLTGSGLISTLTKSNAMLVVDESIEGYDEGDEVEVALTAAVSHGAQHSDSRQRPSRQAD
jgi:molybdopterin molybdotransferase